MCVRRSPQTRGGLRPRAMSDNSRHNAIAVRTPAHMPLAVRFLAALSGATNHSACLQSPSLFSAATRIQDPGYVKVVLIFAVAPPTPGVPRQCSPRPEVSVRFPGVARTAIGGTLLDAKSGTRVVQSWPTWGRHRSNSANFGPTVIRCKLAQVGAESTEFGPGSNDLGRLRPT